MISIFKKPVSVHIFLYSLLIIPTNDLTKWNPESYSKKTPNQVRIQNENLTILVEKSASPLFYKLNETKKIKGFKVAGEFMGLPQFKNPSNQGTKGFDDYPLRIGFVVNGDKKLTGIKKYFAAEWVKRVYSLVPENSGIDRIEFFNVSQNEKELGANRIHYSTDLIRETIFAIQKSPGVFSFEYQLKEPIDVVAIWISIDGDDTSSNYEVKLSSIKLNDTHP